jgi:acetaldehyde dehydrogenase (acetylating)
MKAAHLAVKTLLVCVPCIAFAQAVGIAASSDFSARTMRLQYAPEQEGGGAIYELSQAYVRVDQDHVFRATAATARVGKGPVGETTITAKSGIVVNDTSPGSTMHLTNATLVWDPTKSTWDVGAERTVTD